MGDTHGWRRAALDYRSKFEEDFVFSVPGALEGAPPLRIAQAPSATAAEKRLGCRRPAAPADGGSTRGAGPASTSSLAGSDDAEDPIPATGFTVWDAGVLLGAYVSQPEVWRRLTTDVPPRKPARGADAAAAGDDAASTTTTSSPTLRSLSLSRSEPPGNRPRDERPTVLELGAGTGVAGLALASTGAPSSVTLTDLPGVCAFLRRNAWRNAAPAPALARRSRARPNRPTAPIPARTALAVAPLRWGVAADVARLRGGGKRAPDVTLGADLAYTENVSVIENLCATVRACVPRGGVAVFASCRDHRPASVDLLETLLTRDGAFEARRVRGDELAAGFGREGDEEAEMAAGRESFRVVEFRRVAGDAMSDAEAEAIRARDAR